MDSGKYRGRLADLAPWQPWAVIVVACNEADVDRVRSRLGELGARVEEVVAPSAGRRVVLARVDEERCAEHVAFTMREEGEAAVARSDRAGLAWHRDTTPLRYGDRLSVCFAWSEHHRGDLPGLIELGTGGWGNGQHPSTALVIEALLSRIRGGERVLDVGCGSGILGLCALRLGASSVVATDIDRGSVDAARRNAALNGMASRLTTVPSLTVADGRFDVVLANIGRAATVELAARLICRLTPTGWLAVSGISPAQCSLVAGYLHPLVELERRTSGEWSSVVLGGDGG